jgi:hypothetical protein
VNHKRLYRVYRDPGPMLEAQEAQTLWARRLFPSADNSGKPRMGSGFLSRCGCSRTGHPGSGRGRRSHAWMSCFGGRYGIRQPPSDSVCWRK